MLLYFPLCEVKWKIFVLTSKVSLGKDDDFYARRIFCLNCQKKPSVLGMNLVQADSNNSLRAFKAVVVNDIN